MKISLIFALTLISIITYSQSLQFDQALFMEMEGQPQAIASIVDSFILNIPVGKVVKLSEARASYFNSINNAHEVETGVQILLNDRVLYSSAAGMHNMNTIWLPAGTYVFKMQSGPHASRIMKGYVSGIMFTVIP